MKHTIKKQVLLLEVEASLDAFALQQAASSYYWGRIVPALEKLFDQLSEEGEWVRLDKLEIDLGKITESVLQERELDLELYVLLREQLKEALTRKGREKESLLHREAVAEHALRQWWYYMEHGRLHWGQSAPDAGWYGRVLELFSVDHAAVSRLRETIQHKPLLLQRIAAQHRDEFLERLAGILVAEELPGSVAWIEAIVRLGRLLEAADPRGGSLRVKREGLVKGPSIRQRWAAWRERHREFLAAGEVRRKAVVWRYLLSEASARGSSLRRGGGAKLLLQWLTDDDPVLLRYLRRKSPVLPAGMQWPTIEEGSGGRPIKEGSPDGKAAAETGVETGISDRRKGGAERRGPSDVVDEEGFYVPHAGIILLHPFLATCFSRLRWWEEGKFVDEAAREKAVFLLHYLATGERDEVPEYMLALPKVLCGWPDETPLAARGGLEEGDYVEADSLLEMALVRWDKLKGSSTDGLREGFLRRGGKLVRRRGGLGLLVEQHALDVLLDYLPWGLGVVKLPWLKEIIYVEWR